MGAPDDVVADAVAHPGDLANRSDRQLAVWLGARLAGTEAGFAAKERDLIAVARSDRGLWNEARDVVLQTIPTVMRWVGDSAARAVVAHEAEIEAGEQKVAGRPRRTLILWLNQVHGPGQVEGG
jgi:hypothetical protein